MNPRIRRRSPLLLTILATCGCLAPACTTSEGPQPAPIELSALLDASKTILDVGSRVELTRLIATKHPALLPLLDRPKVGPEGGVIEPADGQIDIDEIVAWATKITDWSPKNAADLVALYLVVRHVADGGGK